MRTAALYVLTTALSLAQVRASPPNACSANNDKAGLVSRDGGSQMVKRDGLFGSLFGNGDNDGGKGGGGGNQDNANNQGGQGVETVTETIQQTITINGAGAIGGINATATMTVTVTESVGSVADASQSDGVNADKFEG